VSPGWGACCDLILCLVVVVGATLEVEKFVSVQSHRGKEAAMTTARHGSAHIGPSPHRGRVTAGIAVLAIAALPLLALVWLLFD
jgi:hypothetical protein